MSPSKPEQHTNDKPDHVVAKAGNNINHDQKPLEPFGDKLPWAEPAWYTTLASPTTPPLTAPCATTPGDTSTPTSSPTPRRGSRGLVSRARAQSLAGDGPAVARRAPRVPPRGPQDHQDGHHGDPRRPARRLPPPHPQRRVLPLPGRRRDGPRGREPDRAAALINHGTEAQKRRWLPGLFTWETNFCLGVTEPSGGSDVGNLRTTAAKTPDGSHYVVNGTKKWITGSPWATHMTTAVRTGPPGSGVSGISLLVIPLTLEGVTIEKIHNSGQNAGGASWVRLHEVQVPADYLLGVENAGFKYLMTNFNKERFVLAVSCNRHARTCLSTSLAYALERETFGQPLAGHQVIRHKLATLAREVEAHWAWLEQIAYHIDADPRGWRTESVAGRIALAKVSGGRILELAAREAQQIMGGVAYQRGGPGGGGAVEQITRDLRMNVVGGGSEEILNDLAFREEMKRAKKIGANL
ncbi:acyl-CoA dehydrogenase domain-containing protein [Apiospora hydei]|uniref:Acyl-CoA dehydrogenase domain-containing protein n=1 Tax=Apiospora hydei TaxID=1337664 RepID=A0ABR1VIZ4_9PEZI